MEIYHFKGIKKMKIHLQTLLVDKYTLIHYRVIDKIFLFNEMQYKLFNKQLNKTLCIDESNLNDFIKPSIQDYLG
jgi:hypothetical protein